MNPLNGKPLVFVVDDEPIIASTVALILGHYGMSAQSFTQPLLALQAARSNAPDLLISDVVMPEMSGIELANRVKEQCPDCKVLLISGNAATNDLLRGARARGKDFTVLAKPVHPTDLLKSIHSLITAALPLVASPRNSTVLQK